MDTPDAGDGVCRWRRKTRRTIQGNTQTRRRPGDRCIECWPWQGAYPLQGQPATEYVRKSQTPTRSRQWSCSRPPSQLIGSREVPLLRLHRLIHLEHPYGRRARKARLPLPGLPTKRAFKHLCRWRIRAVLLPKQYPSLHRWLPASSSRTVALQLKGSLSSPSGVLPDLPGVPTRQACDLPSNQNPKSTGGRDVSPA